MTIMQTIGLVIFLFIFTRFCDSARDAIIFYPYRNLFPDTMFWQRPNGKRFLLFKVDAWHIIKLIEHSCYALMPLLVLNHFYHFGIWKIILISIFLAYLNLIFHEVALKDLFKRKPAQNIPNAPEEIYLGFDQEQQAIRVANFQTKRTPHKYNRSTSDDKQRT